ncbi:MAG: radical SAM protein [Oscillospiraceae bacterium]
MKKFKKVYIEITNSCNLSCSFCPKTHRKLEFMSVEDFEKVIDKVGDRADNVYLHVMGEPTAHPDFANIIRVCQQRNIKTNITTNGTLLKTQGEVILQGAVRMVSVSLHSFEANSLDENMQSYLEQVLDFCKKAMESKTIVELRLWNMDSDSLYDVNRLNGQIIAYLQDYFQLNFDLSQELADKFLKGQSSNSRKHNLKLKDNIYIGMAEHFQWPDITKSKGEVCEGFCYGLRNQVAILVNGDLVPCCLDSEGNIVLGNIFSSDLEDILQSERALRLFEGFSQRRALEPLCQTCGYMKKFTHKG